jgi:hypothetical protein
MSDATEVDNALSLEDLFLSQEFGQPRTGTALVDSEPTLFGGVPPRGPLVPLAATSLTAQVGHGTTTHVRRNRTLFASVSGVAAALLVALGIVSQTGTNKPSGTSGVAIKPTTPTTTGQTPPPVGDLPPVVSVPPTTVGSGSPSSSGATLASFSGGSSSGSGG